MQNNSLGPWGKAEVIRNYIACWIKIINPSAPSVFILLRTYAIIKITGENAGGTKAYFRKSVPPCRQISCQIKLKYPIRRAPIAQRSCIKEIKSCRDTSGPCIHRKREQLAKPCFRGRIPTGSTVFAVRILSRVFSWKRATTAWNSSRMSRDAKSLSKLCPKFPLAFSNRSTRSI